MGSEACRASNVVHSLAEISALAHDVANDSVPLFLDLSPEHKESLVNVLTQLKCDLDELRDAIQDIEPDFTELVKYLRRSDLKQ